MDQVERLIQAFSARPTASVLWKLDVLLDLERLADPRIVPFLLQVLQDRQEPTTVRSRVVRLLQNGTCPADARASAARALTEVLVDRGSPNLRVAAALALAEFTDVVGVPLALGAVALDAAESLDLRYSAFTSLERAGPEPGCAALLRLLSTDDALGRSAQSLLERWRLAS